jgi:hypothetical protein
MLQPTNRLRFLLTQGNEVSIYSRDELTRADMLKMIRLLECTADGLEAAPRSSASAASAR